MKGDEKVERKILITVLALAAIIVITASSFGDVSAQESFTEHINAYGSTVVNIAGHPQLIIDAYHFNSGEFGSGDALRIFNYQDTQSGPVFQCVAVFTDMPDRFTFLQQLFTGTPTSVQLVSTSNLEVSREGNSKTIMIVWKTPLEVPTEENWSGGQISAFTVPPGRLIVRGHGDVITGSGIASSDGWLQSLKWTGYTGDATFTCPTWHFGGPVGETDGQNPTTIYTDATLVTQELS
jgi:hypothetical protein